jgi:hypothetical protein
MWVGFSEVHWRALVDMIMSLLNEDFALLIWSINWMYEDHYLTKGERPRYETYIYLN